MAFILKADLTADVSSVVDFLNEVMNGGIGFCEYNTAQKNCIFSLPIDGSTLRNRYLDVSLSNYDSRKCAGMCTSVTNTTSSGSGTPHSYLCLLECKWN